jgi:hypothetical protein
MTQYYYTKAIADNWVIKRCAEGKNRDDNSPYQWICFNETTFGSFLKFDSYFCTTEACQGNEHRPHYVSVYNNYQFWALTSFRHIAWRLRCNLHINSLSSIHPLAFDIITSPFPFRPVSPTETPLHNVNLPKIYTHACTSVWIRICDQKACIEKMNKFIKSHCFTINPSLLFHV